jgi:hypothetical protein
MEVEQQMAEVVNEHEAKEIVMALQEKSIRVGGQFSCFLSFFFSN